jgi:anti-sigma-K factor RskA
MSGAEETGDRLDMLAGEYVLGLLDDAAARDVERRARTEQPLAAAIAAWRSRLDPLTDLPAPVPPGDLLWRRIEADLPTRPAQHSALPPARGPGPWRALALASMALAAGLAAIIWLRQPVIPQPWTQAVALLTAPGSVQAAVRAQVTSAGTITVVPLTKVTVQPGHQLGFWVWPKGAPAPTLLGMIAPDGGQLRFPATALDGTPVMVTSEPSTGVGAAPGPTLFIGLLAATT